MKDGLENSTQSNKDAKTAKIILSVLLALIIAVLGFGGGFLTSRLTLSKELRSMEWALKTIKENYYFYDGFDRDGAGDLTMYALASKLDKYSAYYTKEEYQAVISDNAGSKSGIGVMFSFADGRGAVVVNVMGNSPASSAGLKKGDTVTGGIKDGKEVVFASSAELSEYLDGFADGEEFALLTGDGQYTLAKRDYNASYCTMATKNTAWECIPSNDGVALKERRDLAVEYLPEGTAYFNLSQFYGRAGDEFGQLLGKFNAENCTSLILDLRNNGGGYVSVMQDIAGYFTSSLGSGSKVAMSAEYKNGYTELYGCYSHKNNLVSPDTTVYVLANSGTASASEALIGVLVDYGFLEYRNIFLSDYSEEYLEWAGEGAKTAQTYGKGIMQSTFVNKSTGEALKLTTARICWPNGKCIHDVGLTAKDGCTPVFAEWSATKGDTELQRVLDVIATR